MTSGKPLYFMTNTPTSGQLFFFQIAMWQNAFKTNAVLQVHLPSGAQWLPCKIMDLNMIWALLITSVSFFNWVAKASHNILHFVVANWARSSESSNIWACRMGTTAVWGSAIANNCLGVDGDDPDVACAEAEIATADASCATLSQS